MKNMNRDLRVRPNSEGLTPKMRRENLKSYINIDGLPVGYAPPRTGRQCKPVNQGTEGSPLNPEVKHPRKDQAMGANT
jgi:hypothetical protein